MIKDYDHILYLTVLLDIKRHISSSKQSILFGYDL